IYLRQHRLQTKQEVAGVILSHLSIIEWSLLILRPAAKLSSPAAATSIVVRRRQRSNAERSSDRIVHQIVKGRFAQHLSGVNRSARITCVSRRGSGSSVRARAGLQ